MTATEFISAYPTVPYLRKVLDQEGTHILSENLQALPWGRTTIGAVIHSVYFLPQDVRTLWNIIHAEAKRLGMIA